MKYVSYTKLEIHGIRSSLFKSLSALKRETEQVEMGIMKIDELLKETNNKNEKETFIIPQELLNFSGTVKNVAKEINWKDSVYSIIKTSPHSLNSTMIYNKMKINFPCEITNRRSAMKNISCALTNLVSEGKLGKLKGEERLLYFGDIQKHFGKTGKANSNFFKN